MSLLETMVGWLAPSLCVGCGAEGTSLCVACATSEILSFGERCFSCDALSEKSRTCLKCRQNGAPNSVYVSTTYDGIAKDLLQKYKFGQHRAASSSITSLMAETFISLNGYEAIAQSNYLVIPVPTATSRVRQRGFDHADLLARMLANKLKLQKGKPLIRFGQTRQVGVSRLSRLRQLEGSYFVRKPELVAGKNILLVDDVVTTGATLRAATKELKKAGARRVDSLVFAKRL
jgi:competence protein ComFC